MCMGFDEADIDLQKCLETFICDSCGLSFDGYEKKIILMGGRVAYELCSRCDHGGDVVTREVR